MTVHLLRIRVFLASVKIIRDKMQNSIPNQNAHRCQLIDFVGCSAQSPAAGKASMSVTHLSMLCLPHYYGEDWTSLSHLLGKHLGLPTGCFLLCDSLAMQSNKRDQKQEAETLHSTDSQWIQTELVLTLKYHKLAVCQCSC